jgi:hypothetical protein
MGCGGGGDAAAQARQQQQQQEQWTNQATTGINQAFSGFTPDFYKGVGNAYQQYALPQVQQQYQNSANQLGFKLAGQGLQKSSAANTMGNALANTMSQAQQTVGNTATQQENQLKGQVAQEQANLIGQAQTTSQPTQLSQMALAQAAGSASPSSFAPVGNMFNTFGQMYLGNQAANTYNGFSGNYLNNITNPGLFSLLGGGGNSLPGATLYGGQ